MNLPAANQPMAANGDAEASNASTPMSQGNQQYSDPPPYQPPKPSKKTEEALIARVARFQAEQERQRAEAQAAMNNGTQNGTSNGTSNGTNCHPADDKSTKVDTPRQ